jgi:hypothetical protein
MSPSCCPEKFTSRSTAAPRINFGHQQWYSPRSSRTLWSGSGRRYITSYEWRPSSLPIGIMHRSTMFPLAMPVWMSVSNAELPIYS